MSRFNVNNASRQRRRFVVGDLNPNVDSISITQTLGVMLDGSLWKILVQLRDIAIPIWMTQNDIKKMTALSWSQSFWKKIIKLLRNGLQSRGEQTVAETVEVNGLKQVSNLEDTPGIKVFDQILGLRWNSMLKQVEYLGRWKGSTPDLKQWCLEDDLVGDHLVRELKPSALFLKNKFLGKRFQYTFLRKSPSDFANKIQSLTDSSTEIVDEATTTDVEKSGDDLQVVINAYGCKTKIHLHEIGNELQCTVDVKQVQ